MLDVWCLKPRSFHFSKFGSCSVLLFGGYKPQNLESRNPEVLVPHPFTFWNSGVVVCFRLVVANPETPNAEISKCCPTSFHLFRTREWLCVVIGILKISKPQTPKSRNNSSFFSQYRNCCMLSMETVKPKTPLKSQSLGPTFPFFAFRRFVYVVVWTLALTKSQTSNSQNPDHLSHFRELLCVDD
jgi:hypothetical protein